MSWQACRLWSVTAEIRVLSDVNPYEKNNKHTAAHFRVCSPGSHISDIFRIIIASPMLMPDTL